MRQLLARLGLVLFTRFAAEPEVAPEPAPAPSTEDPAPQPSRNLFLDEVDLTARLDAWLLWTCGTRLSLPPWKALHVLDTGFAQYCAAEWGVVPSFGAIESPPDTLVTVCCFQRVQVGQSVMRLIVSDCEEHGLTVDVRVETPDEQAACEALGATLLPKKAGTI